MKKSIMQALVSIPMLCVVATASAETSVSRFSEEQFAERMMAVDINSIETLQGYAGTLIDGGNRIRFSPDRRLTSVPLIDLQRSDMDRISVGALIVFVHEQCMGSQDGLGIAEVFLWNRRFQVTFSDEASAPEAQEVIGQEHELSSARAWDERGDTPFSLVCTRPD